MCNHSMIDDILAVSKCSVNSIKLNAMIESKVNNKQLTMGQNKCAPFTHWQQQF